MSGISTHILDTSRGLPAAGVAVTLECWELDAWMPLATSQTDSDGRCKGLLAAEKVAVGRYRLTFATGEYFAGETLYPEVVIVFAVAEAGGSYHVPLLVSGFGYTTYRGS